MLVRPGRDHGITDGLDCRPLSRLPLSRLFGAGGTRRDGIAQIAAGKGGRVRITKVYTRTGDAGKTRLAGGQQVWKDSLRVEAYGTIDELNASIGVVRVMNAELVEESEAAGRLEQELRWVQNKLFDVGSLLATAPGQTFTNMPQISAQDVTRLEKLIDCCQKDLEPLREFILPGGGKVSGFLHQARTVCRRAERLCVALAKEEPVDPVIIKYVNRLSDALFVLARWVAKTQGEPEFLWERDGAGKTK